MASTQRAVIVGGGVLGTMHAVAARRRGFEVVHLEREAEARGASVRNFGLVWVSGRKAGRELGLALRARELWAELGARVPGLGFRAAGSLTLATGDAELALLKEAAALPDAERRGFELLDPTAVREVNPALRGEFAGGLLCRADAIVEPRQVLPALRGCLAARGQGTSGYTWLPGREVTEVAPNAVRDHTGAWHRGDLVILCPGAAHTGVAGASLARGGVLGVRRVRLQMMQTAPLAERVTTALADGDSLRYYPAYDLPGRVQLPRRTPRPGGPAPSCCWSSGPTAGSPSATRTNTPSRSRSTSTRTPTNTCAPGPRRCLARRSRGCSDAGPGSTVRWTPTWPVAHFTTGPRSSPALSWSPGQAGVA